MSVMNKIEPFLLMVYNEGLWPIISVFSLRVNKLNKYHRLFYVIMGMGICQLFRNVDPFIEDMLLSHTL